MILPTFADVESAAAQIRGVAHHTPVLTSRTVNERTGAEVFFKCENFQRGGAFKFRGAYNALSRLSPDEQRRGVVTFSSGNHAQAIALAGRVLNIPRVIVMPSDAPAVKVDRVRADGAEIVVVGPSSEERAERAAELAARDGLALVAPYDDAATITGQGTIGLEIVEQLAELDEPDERTAAGRASAVARTRVGDGAGDGALRDGDPPVLVLVPVGGGGIASGVAVAVKSLLLGAKVIGVEPELAADARDSLREGRIVTWPADLVGRTIADGQRTAHIGRIPFAHLRRHLDGIVTVGEDEIARAMVRGARESRLVLEPSGATTLAALLFHSDELPPALRAVAILSGGNVDPARYEELLARGVAAGG